VHDDLIRRGTVDWLVDLDVGEIVAEALGLRAAAAAR